MTERTAPALVWLRDDLRLADNPALAAAIASGRPLALVYCLDEESAGIRPLGGATRWWLHRSLDTLQQRFAAHGHSLILRRGKGVAVIEALIDSLQPAEVHWNRRYGGGERAVDAAVKAWLKERGIAAESHQANLLFEPWTVRTQANQPFRVFTPFWRACRSLPPPRQPLPAPSQWPEPAAEIASDTLSDWNLLPHHPDWAGGLRAAWTPGEAGANDRFTEFLAGGLRLYADHRDEPAVDATSRLSPHLRFGEISPFQLCHAIEAAGHAGDPPPPQRSVDKFLAELGWREFSWHLLFHQDDLATRNFQPRFDAFRWAEPDATALKAWQHGRTGFPIVDAGMRQLWQTGWMHSRVRMITASFLIKNLLTDWRIGEAWFWDTLVDADSASNPAGWQWVAGSGADAAPYFRIFNPVRQGEQFDPKGDYIRAFVPELATAPTAGIHQPKPGGHASYPAPIVDLGTTRDRALAAFAAIKDAS